MNIYELSKKSRVPLKSLRKLDELRALKIDAENDKMSKLVFHMAKNQRYTLPMLLWFLDDPGLLEDIGIESRRYQQRATVQLGELGDIAATSAPKHVTAEIREAGKGDDDAALVIANWLRLILPVEPVGHQWVAARLLAPLDEFLREQSAPMISLALLNVRRLPEFAGFWESEKIAKKNQIRYFSLDL